jgi:hypothetical protein
LLFFFWFGFVPLLTVAAKTGGGTKDFSAAAECFWYINFIYGDSIATGFYAFDDFALLFLSCSLGPYFSGEREFAARVFWL